MKELSFKDLRGKVLLIGLTYYSKNGDFEEQKQLWGTVAEANEKAITIIQSNGELFSLPPDLSSVIAADPGEYTLHTTNEVVVNPDYLSTWSITKSD